MKTRTIYSSIIALFSIILLFAMVQPSLAIMPDPTPIDLGTLDGCVSSMAIDVNSAGQVVGFSFSNDPNQAQNLPFVWQNGVMTALPMPDGYSTGRAVSINDSGVIAGHCQVTLGLYNPYSLCEWTMVNGQWCVTKLGTPDDDTYDSVKACKINNNGQILVVLSNKNNWDYTNAAIWNGVSWSVLTSTVDNMNYPVTVKYDIYNPNTKSPTMNDNAQVLLHIESVTSGYNDLYAWDDHKLYLIVTLASPGNSAHMNNLGQVVGIHVSDNTHENFAYDIKTQKLIKALVIDYSNPNAPVINPRLADINDKEQILLVYGAVGGSAGTTTELGLTTFDDWQSNTNNATATFLGDVPGTMSVGKVFLTENGAASCPCQTLSHFNS